MEVDCIWGSKQCDIENDSNEEKLDLGDGGDHMTIVSYNELECQFGNNFGLGCCPTTKGGRSWQWATPHA